MTTESPGRTVLHQQDLRTPVAEIAVQAVLIAAAALLVGLLQGQDVPERALGTLTFAAGVAATILLAVGAWMSGSRHARRISAAVGLYTLVALLLGAVEVDGGLWSVGGSIAVLGVAGLLLTAVAAPLRPGRRVTMAVPLLVGSGLATLALVGLLAPEHTPPPTAVLGLKAAGWSATAAAGLVLVAAGHVQERPVARRSGLAFAALGGAHVTALLVDRPQVTGVLELAAVAMLLLTAVLVLAHAVASVGREQEESRTRAEHAEAVVAAIAERDHELRNLVAGLHGAASVLRDEEMGRSGQARALLLAAGAELSRLQAMLDGPRIEAGEAEVGPLLRDLAAVHRAAGMDVSVEVVGRPQVATGPHVVAQIVTNLLVNCARHAPGARVVIRSGGYGRQVRIEVSDDGPGLPAGAADTLLRRGARGPRSTGSGLGLAITAELVERCRGAFSLSSAQRGCTAVVHLPMAGRPARLEPVGA